MLVWVFGASMPLGSSKLPIKRNAIDGDFASRALRFFQHRSVHSPLSLASVRHLAHSVGPFRLGYDELQEPVALYGITSRFLRGAVSKDQSSASDLLCSAAPRWSRRTTPRSCRNRTMFGSSALIRKRRTRRQSGRILDSVSRNDVLGASIIGMRLTCRRRRRRIT